MAWLPTRVDLWLARELAGLLTHHPQFGLGVQEAIQHNILGGFWFGAALFICWVQGARKGQDGVRLRMLTILIGTTLAILLTVGAGAIVSWPPPVRYPGLSKLFPDYLDIGPSLSSFPSQSTALYSAVAAGVYSLHKATGRLLWLMVILGVALPRMCVGGHFLTDIVAGLLLALIGYASARWLLEARLTTKIEPFLQERPRLRILTDLLLFVWILQVSVEFRDVAWLQSLLGGVGH